MFEDAVKILLSWWCFLSLADEAHVAQIWTRIPIYSKHQRKLNVVGHSTELLSFTVLSYLPKSNLNEKLYSVWACKCNTQYFAGVGI